MPSSGSDGRRVLARRTVTIGAIAAVGLVAARAADGNGSGSTTSAPGAAPAPTGPAPGANPLTGPAASPGTGPSAGAGAGPSGPSPSTSTSPAPRPSSAPATRTRPLLELPRGGRTLFPRYRLVGYSGGPGSAAFGRLGVGDLDDRIREIERLGRQYAAGRRPLPVLELITVVVQSAPGRDGLYRTRIDPGIVAEHLAAARRHDALLLLNVQPGRARFLDEVRALRRWLAEPDVGVALDPEWAVGPGQVPGRVFGSMTGAQIDQVAAYLDGVVRDGGLPQKALVVHQLAPSVVRRMEAVRARPGVAVVKSVDGIGSPGAKRATWRRLTTRLPRPVHPGFKLFFEEDARGAGRLMTPREVLALRPTPEYVLYE